MKKVEDRYNQRKALSLDIMLSVRDLGLMSGKTRNVSLGGMSVDIGRISLEKDRLVDIVFPVNCGDESRQCKARAVVAHSSLGDIGLMFSELDSNVTQMLRKLLFGYATVSQRTYLAQNNSDSTHAVSCHE